MTKLSMSEEEMLKRKYTRPYEKRIAELEQENAELKARVNEQSERISELTQELDDKINRFER